jgi:hypothetical protein
MRWQIYIRHIKQIPFVLECVNFYIVSENEKKKWDSSIICFKIFSIYVNKFMFFIHFEKRYNISFIFIIFSWNIKYVCHIFTTKLFIRGYRIAFISKFVY